MSENPQRKFKWLRIFVSVGIMFPAMVIGIFTNVLFSSGKNPIWQLALCFLMMAMLAQRLIYFTVKKNTSLQSSLSTNYLRSLYVFFGFFLAMTSFSHLVILFGQVTVTSSKYSIAGESATLAFGLILLSCSGILARKHRKLIGLPDEGEVESFGTYILKHNEYACVDSEQNKTP